LILWEPYQALVPTPRSSLCKRTPLHFASSRARRSGTAPSGRLTIPFRCRRVASSSRCRRRATYITKLPKARAPTAGWQRNGSPDPGRDPVRTADDDWHRIASIGRESERCCAVFNPDRKKKKYHPWDAASSSGSIVYRRIRWGSTLVSLVRLSTIAA